MAIFEGGAGNDIHVGGDADDSIKGNGGNDTLTGGGGNDQIDGGAGTDFAVFSGLLSDYRFIWDADTRRLIVSDLRAGSPDGADIVTNVEGFQFSNVRINLNQALVRAVAPIQGTTGDDDITPTSAPAGQAKPGSLADLVKAGSGNDAVDGGAGNDFLYGEGGNDVIAGGDGADLLDGGDGDDTLYSGQQSPAFNSPNGLNPPFLPLLDTGTAVDTLVGGAGNDRIFAGYGDHVDGGSNDVAGDTLYISFQGASTGVTFDDSLATQTIGGATITGIEKVAWVEGSNFDDVLMGGNSPTSGGLPPIFGMGGNDHIIARYYSGNLYGGDGNDIVDARNSGYSSVIDGGNGDDLIRTSTGLQVAYGGDGNDIIYGNHRIYGGAGNDRIFVQSSVYQQEFRGGDGDDVITVELGFVQSAMIYGDAGNDTIIGGVSNDRMEGGAGDDLLIGGAGNGDRAFYSGRLSDYRIINDPAGGQLIVIDLRPGSPDGTDVVRTIEQFQFLDGPKTLAQVTAVAVPPIQGTNGADTITTTVSDPSSIPLTTAQADVVYAGGGNDKVRGGGGNDWLYGDDGADSIAGDAGADTLYGGDGNDTLYSGSVSPAFTAPYYDAPYTAPLLDTGAEVDALYGGNGDDRLFAGYGDTIDGGDGFDTLHVSFRGATTGVTAAFGLNSQSISGSIITSVEAVGWIEGSEFDDHITVTTTGFNGEFTQIFGLGGNDHLVAGYYTNNLFGGDGNDILDARASQYLYTVDGGDGDDTIYTRGGLGEVTKGGAGNDIIHAGGEIYGDAGNDKIFILDSFYSRDVHGGDGDDEITAPAGGYYPANTIVLYGDAGNDRLTGGAASDSFDGGKGNDMIIGGGEAASGIGFDGDRAIYGGNVADYAVSRDSGTGIVTVVDLRAGSPDGTDTLDGIEMLSFANGTYLIDIVLAGLATGEAGFEGGAEADIFRGSEEANIANGNGGDDILQGNGGNDILAGGDGSDQIDGGDGEDRLHAGAVLGSFSAPESSESHVTPQLDRGAAVDVLLGGAGNDILSAGYGDHVDGGDDRDELFISFQGATSGVTFDLGLGTQVIGGGTITGIENIGWVEGSEFGDHIVGTSDSLSGDGPLFGMGGDDHLVAGYYTGALFGGTGNDIVDGRPSQYLYQVNGGDGDDTLYTNSNSFAAAYGGDGNDVIYGHREIFGDAGDDKIYVQFSYYGGDVHGGDGNDQIYAPVDGYPYANGTRLYGDAGNDLIVGGAGADIMNGGAGDDMIIGGAENDLAIYSGRRSDYRIAWDPTGQQYILTDLRPGSPDGTDVVSGVERFQFRDGIRQATALPAIAVKPIQGTAGDDMITPTSAPAGQAMPGAQVDVIYGNGGNDTLQGGGGGDWMYGGIGDDVYIIEDADDHMVERAGEGIDTAKTSKVNLILGDHVENGMLKGSLNLQAVGNALANDLRGNGAANKMSGGDGDDVIYGGGGMDRLFGEEGDDRLFGDDGNDRLVGGAGADQLTGGDGADIFHFLAAGDSTVALVGRDTIFDFSQAAGDKIMLSDIDADGNAANGDTGFAFIGNAEFTMVAGQLRSIHDGTNTLVFADIDGDGNADFALTLTGNIDLSGGDFIL